MHADADTHTDPPPQDIDTLRDTAIGTDMAIKYVHDSCMTWSQEWLYWRGLAAVYPSDIDIQAGTHPDPWIHTSRQTEIKTHKCACMDQPRYRLKHILRHAQTLRHFFPVLKSVKTMMWAFLYLEEKLTYIGTLSTNIHAISYFIARSPRNIRTYKCIIPSSMMKEFKSINRKRAWKFVAHTWSPRR